MKHGSCELSRDVFECLTHNFDFGYVLCESPGSCSTRREPPSKYKLPHKCQYCKHATGS